MNLRMWGNSMTDCQFKMNKNEYFVSLYIINVYSELFIKMLCYVFS